MTDLLTLGPRDARFHLILAHGAGAPMTSPFLDALASAITAQGLQVTRFNFAYMAKRSEGNRRPPPKAELLIPELCAVVEAVAKSSPARQKLLIGGKSMGGRVASMAAGELHARGRIGAVGVVGYPFHPPGKPAQLRTAHLTDLKCPMLIVQGERDPFGSRQEVSGYTLSSSIELAWIARADHDLSPERGSGLRKAELIAQAACEIARFASTKAG